MTASEHAAPSAGPRARLARRFQSDLLGLRLSTERPDVDAHALATEMADDLDALAA